MRKPFSIVLVRAAAWTQPKALLALQGVPWLHCKFLFAIFRKPALASLALLHVQLLQQKRLSMIKPALTCFQKILLLEELQWVGTDEQSSHRQLHSPLKVSELLLLALRHGLRLMCPAHHRQAKGLFRSWTRDCASHATLIWRLVCSLMAVWEELLAMLLVTITESQQGSKGNKLHKHDGDRIRLGVVWNRGGGGRNGGGG